MVKAPRGTDTGSWGKILGVPHIIAIPDSGFNFPSWRAILTRFLKRTTNDPQEMDRRRPPGSAVLPQRPRGGCAEIQSSTPASAPGAITVQRQSAIWRRMLASPFLGNTVPRSHGDNRCPEDQVQKSGDKQKPFEDLPHNEFQSRMIQLLPMSSLGLQKPAQVAS